MFLRTRREASASPLNSYPIIFLEVDFIIEDGGKCIAMEVKAAARWEKGDLSGLKAFVASTPRCLAGILAYNGASPVRLGERLWAIPLGLLLS